MEVCVAGLWHLGSVTAACLAKAGHQVTGLDFSAETVTGLEAGTAPIHEPGLDALIAEQMQAGRLSFSTDPAQAVSGVQVVWITWDTPVDDDDVADVEAVLANVERLFEHVGNDTVFVISSQLPVGSTNRLREQFEQLYPERTGVGFACSPENLRLGKAIEVFSQPDRVVVGVANQSDKEVVGELLDPIAERIEWMSVESAEMTKHAVNSFLAASVTFINELAVLCEQVGADAKEVERGLKSERRIGPSAYLGPGGAFAGGTLARDVTFLTELGEQHHVPTHLFQAIKRSNDEHRGWAERKILQLLGQAPTDAVVAVWGLTYKPGTDTLRRSSAVELVRNLAARGMTVRAHDPAISTVPHELAEVLELADSAAAAAAGADALVVATEWPDYLSVPMDQILQSMRRPNVVDANRFLARSDKADALDAATYVAVGVPAQ